MNRVASDLQMITEVFCFSDLGNLMQSERFVHLYSIYMNILMTCFLKLTSMALTEVVQKLYKNLQVKNPW